MKANNLAKGNLLALLEELELAALKVMQVLKCRGLDYASRLRRARAAMNYARAKLAKFRSLFRVANACWYSTCMDEMRELPALDLTAVRSTTTTTTIGA